MTEFLTALLAAFCMAAGPAAVEMQEPASDTNHGIVNQETDDEQDVFKEPPLEIQPILVTPTPTPTPEPTPTPTPEPEMVLWGTCRITHYCSCPICCGEWSGGPTASGTTPTAGRTVACDLPFGTVIVINGREYVVEDRGVSGMAVDVFVASHDEALQKGLYYADVYVKGGENK